MGYYTKNYLLDLGEQTSEKQRRFSESVNENRNRTSFDIFLSHSFKDQKYIRGLFTELTRQGYSVYVDWIVDAHLSRENVTKTTAETVRKRIKQSKSLIYATSDNSVNSKWMPWELGFADGEKGRCAILPITDSTNSSFNGQEYLSIYPYVTANNLNSMPSQRVIRVNESDYRYVEMSKWHQGEKPTFQN